MTPGPWSVWALVVFAFGGVIKNIFQNTCNSVGASGGGSG